MHLWACLLAQLIKSTKWTGQAFEWRPILEDVACQQMRDQAQALEALRVNYLLSLKSTIIILTTSFPFHSYAAAHAWPRQEERRRKFPRYRKTWHSLVKVSSLYFFLNYLCICILYIKVCVFYDSRLNMEDKVRSQEKASSRHSTGDFKKDNRKR